MVEESITLDVPVSEAVKVSFYRSGDTDQNPVKLCEVEGRKIQCDPSYEERVVFQASLQLKDMTDSDGGIYTIVDTKNKETVSTYKITVRGKTLTDFWCHLNVQVRSILYSLLYWGIH